MTNDEENGARLKSEGGEESHTTTTTTYRNILDDHVADKAFVTENANVDNDDDVVDQGTRPGLTHPDPKEPSSPNSINFPETNHDQANPSPHPDEWNHMNAEIVLLFEFYSTDFYQDKLQGCSHLTLPLRCCRRRQRQIINPIENGDTHFLVHYQPTQVSLNILKPEMISVIDKLRYYLIGQLPREVKESFLNVSVN